jgi:hypothetical protein
MKQEEVVSRKWKKLYTYMLIANAVYIVLFYMITQFYS